MKNLILAWNDSDMFAGIMSAEHDTVLHADIFPLQQVQNPRNLFLCSVYAYEKKSIGLESKLELELGLKLE